MIPTKALLVEVQHHNTDIGSMLQNNESLTFYVVVKDDIIIVPDDTEIIMTVKRREDGQLFGTTDDWATAFPILGAVRTNLIVKVLDPHGVL